MTDGLRRGLTNYGDRDFALYLRRSFARSMGYSTAALARPIVGIADSRSGFNNCHRHLPELMEAVRRGVTAAGGLALDFPTISLGEVFLEPTSMLYRNLMSMDVEEMVRAQPMDAVVLVGGCDKTIPAQLMGAASAGVPAIQVPAGSMMTGRWQGERLGACTDCRRFWGKYRAGQVSPDEIDGHRRAAGDHDGDVRGNGDGEHDGVCGRGPRHDGGGRGRRARRPRRPVARGRSIRRSGGCIGAIGADTGTDHDAGRGRKCPTRARSP